MLNLSLTRGLYRPGDFNRPAGGTTERGGYRGYNATHRLKAVEGNFWAVESGRRERLKPARD
jgi:hypothetical protein